LDIWVDRKVIIDVKSVEQMLPVQCETSFDLLATDQKQTWLAFEF